MSIRLAAGTPTTPSMLSPWTSSEKTPGYLRITISSCKDSRNFTSCSHHVHTLLYDGKLHQAPLKKDIKVCLSTLTDSPWLLY